MTPATSFYLDLFKRMLDLRRTIIWSLMALNLGFAITIFTSKDPIVGKLSADWSLKVLYVLTFVLGWGGYWLLIKLVDSRVRALLEFISDDLEIKIVDVDRLYLNATKHMQYAPIGASFLIMLLVLVPFK